MWARCARVLPSDPKIRRWRLYAVASASTGGVIVLASSNVFQSSLGEAGLVSACAGGMKAGCGAILRSSRATFTVHLRSARRILKLCETNKGFYIKAGQFVGSLRYVPKEYSSMLSCLQDQAVPCKFEVIREALNQNFGSNLSDIFLVFDEQPIAAASIAQVHHAVLKNLQEVAVKVQYPGLEERMKADIATMSVLSKFFSWLFPEYQFEWIVPEFEKSISTELDFVQEAKNSERTSRNLKKHRLIIVPEIYWDLTTKRILTMQFFYGHKVDDIQFLKEMGIKPKQVAHALMEAFAEMIFVHGFLHGDPHPGNILVSPGGSKGFSVVLLDHGIYRELDKSFRLNYCDLWKALILVDAHEILHLGEKLGAGKYAKYLPVIFTGRTINSKSILGRSMSAEEKQKLKRELSALKMGDLASFMVSLPRDFLTILRTDGLLRSIVSQLGGSQRVRLLAYAKYSINGAATKHDPETNHAWNIISGLRAIMNYVYLRIAIEALELYSQVDDIGKSILKRMHKLLWLVREFLGGQLFPFSSSISS
ncbi:unnamed protein product [Victoria cruziana]